MLEKGVRRQVQSLAIPEHGLTVWLRQFGPVKVLKDQPRHYAVYRPQVGQLAAFDRPAFVRLHDQHWQIDMQGRKEAVVLLAGQSYIAVAPFR